MTGRWPAGSLGPLSALFRETDVGLLVEDADRRVEVTNQAFLTIFGVPATPEQMVGGDCAAAAEAMAPLFADQQSWLTGIGELVTGGRSEHGRVLPLVDGRFLERDYVPILREGAVAGHMWLYRDVSDRERAVLDLERGRRDLDRSNTMLRATNDLLQTVASVQALMLATGDERSVFDKLLAAALELTGSEFGFVGEVHTDPDSGAPYLQTFAITDIAWDAATRQLYDEQAEAGFRFTNPDSLFGTVLTTREVVISNDPRHDPRAGGTPHGHPPLNAFLGLPVLAGGEFLGMVGLANREGGYDEELVEWLSPYLSTCASVLLHARADRARRRSEDELRAARARAEDASAAKNVFLSRMSHELRTPLNAMLGFAQLMEMRGSSDVDRMDAARVVTAGRHLLGLLDDVMDVASLEAGRLALDVRLVPLAQLVDECMTLVRAGADERGVTVECGSVPDDLAVAADPARLRQVLLNLLDNAVKYSRHGGTVRVEVGHPEGDDVTCVDVVDEGVGIPAIHAERVFEPFERVEAPALGVPGSGLGLAVSRSLARAMGGDVALVPAAPGRTVLRVSIPTATGPLTGDGLAPPPPPVEAVVGDVVYVEDNATNAVLVRSVLEHLLPQVTVTVAPTGREALHLLTERTPDLLLLDLHLPDMDGLEVLDRSRLAGAVPVYVLTADATPDTRRRVLSAPVDGILVKPVNPRELADAVGAALQRAARPGHGRAAAPSHRVEGSATR